MNAAVRKLLTIVTEAALESGATMLVDNTGLHVHAPAWLQPKLAQFRAARENQ
jgi:hypothetical protein